MSIIKKIKRRFSLIIVETIKYVPFKFAMRLRNRCYNTLFVSAGNGLNICDGVTIIRPGNLIVGDRVSIHEYSYIGGTGHIKIGNFVSIANNCSIISETHNFEKRDLPIKEQGVTPQSISIGSDVWIGSRVTILGKVKIGNGAVIGAGSIVTKDIPDYAVAFGVPCRVMRYRD